MLLLSKLISLMNPMSQNPMVTYSKINVRRYKADWLHKGIGRDCRLMQAKCSCLVFVRDNVWTSGCKCSKAVGWNSRLSLISKTSGVVKHCVHFSRAIAHHFTERALSIIHNFSFSEKSITERKWWKSCRLKTQTTATQQQIAVRHAGGTRHLAITSYITNYLP